MRAYNNERCPPRTAEHHRQRRAVRCMIAATIDADQTSFISCDVGLCNQHRIWGVLAEAADNTFADGHCMCHIDTAVPALPVESICS